jgi:hypothetical protein
VDGKNTVHKKIYFPLFFETYLSLYMHSKWSSAEES